MYRFTPRAPLEFVTLLAAAVFAPGAWADEDVVTSEPARGGAIVLRTAMVEDQDGDPAAAGRQAAASLKQAMGDAPLKAVILSECFEGRESKEKLLAGVQAALPKTIIFGGATYGSFTQTGSLGFDAVCLLGVGGDGLQVSAALKTNVGVRGLTLEEQPAVVASRLTAAGAKLAGKLPRGQQDRLLIMMSDAHSPTHQFIIDGLQQVIGKQFPITGGSVNKNAGQTFLYFQGRLHEDGAIAMMLSGKFAVALAGRRADDNDGIIRTAKESAAEALSKLAGQPIAMLAFNCGGRRGRLDNVADELAAFQSAVGGKLPLFGCYCAGEIGPVEGADKKPDTLCGGSGWHVMVTAIGP